MKETYYEILDVSENATVDEIKKAYRKKAKEYHPDVNNGEGNEEMLKLVNEAYETLIDPNKRQDYDNKIGIGEQIGVTQQPYNNYHEDQSNTNDYNTQQTYANYRNTQSNTNNYKTQQPYWNYSNTEVNTNNYNTQQAYWDYYNAYQLYWSYYNVYQTNPNYYNQQLMYWSYYHLSKSYQEYYYKLQEDMYKKQVATIPNNIINNLKHQQKFLKLDSLWLAFHKVIYGFRSNSMYYDRLSIERLSYLYDDALKKFNNYRQSFTKEIETKLRNKIYETVVLYYEYLYKITLSLTKKIYIDMKLYHNGLYNYDYDAIYGKILSIIGLSLNDALTFNLNKVNGNVLNSNMQLYIIKNKICNCYRSYLSYKAQASANEYYRQRPKVKSYQR